LRNYAVTSAVSISSFDSSDTAFDIFSSALFPVTSSDAVSGCSITDTVVVSETAEILITVSVQSTMPGQATGNIDATVSGGNSVYTYSWSSVITGFTDSTEDVSGLGYDVYTLTVTDSPMAKF
jgi:hypothetical protein